MLGHSRENGGHMRKALFLTAVAAASVLPSTTAVASTPVSGDCEDLSGSPTQDMFGNGNSDRCLFQGNINGSTNAANVNSFLNAQDAYNALPLGDITLNFITKSDDADFGLFGSITGTGGLSGTYRLPGFTLTHMAVKASNRFYLYQLDGSDSGSWSTAGLLNRNGRQQELSHLTFFGIRSAVPEPASWAFMILGFGAVGASLRLRPPARVKTALG